MKIHKKGSSSQHYSQHHVASAQHLMFNSRKNSLQDSNLTNQIASQSLVNAGGISESHPHL
jgi:hypothetical protein